MAPHNLSELGLTNMIEMESRFPAVSYDEFKRRIEHDISVLKSKGYEVVCPALAFVYHYNTFAIANSWLEYSKKNKNTSGYMCMWHYRHCPIEDLEKRLNRILAVKSL